MSILYPELHRLQHQHRRQQLARPLPRLLRLQSPRVLVEPFKTVGSRPALSRRGSLTATPTIQRSPLTLCTAELIPHSQAATRNKTPIARRTVTNRSGTARSINSSAQCLLAPH